MNFLQSLDVLIGLIVIYLILGLSCTVVNEWIDTLWQTRAKRLRNSLYELLDQKIPPDNIPTDSLTAAFYEHPLIKGLVRRSNGIRKGEDLPTYISHATFRNVLLSVIKNGTESKAELIDFASIEAAIQKLADGGLKEQLVSLLAQVKRQTDKAEEHLAFFQKAIDDWFDEAMERSSDWYRRRTQTWTILTAIALCFALNVDSISITRYLWNDSDAREAYVQAAERIVRQTSPDSLKKVLATVDTADIGRARQQLDTLVKGVRHQLTQNTSLPLGWTYTSTVPPDTFFLWKPFLLFEEFVSQLVPGKWLGLLLSVAAASVGAPFWFDMLKKVMNIRTALKQVTVGANGKKV